MKIVAALLLGLLTLPVWAAPVQVEGVRLWPAPDHTRLVFDVSGPVEHTLFSLEGPDRLVIDIKNGALRKDLGSLGSHEHLVQRVRYAVRNQKDLRVVLDLKSPVRPKSFVLKPNREYGHRLVIDLYDSQAKPRPVAATVATPGRARDVIVAIDAGHGGEDPGAIGRKGTREKDVVLAIARRLAALVEKEPGMRPLLIRDGDYYIKLRDRVEKARENRADIFISIHADAFHDARARGSSVYTLSRNGATSDAARWLAESENAADLVGGVSLDDKDDLLRSVLIDLSRNASIEASHAVATQVLDGMRTLGPLHKPHVEQAAFAVLRSPDVPSILVETAFISNPDEERKLRSTRHQQALAESLMQGIRAYFRKHPPPNTFIAERAREHVIARGETLSGIARRYQISLDSLRTVNGLSSDVLRVGDVLRIPQQGDG